MTDHAAAPALCITPIAGVVRYANGPEELRIGDVRFVSWETLATTWATRGFHADPTTLLRERNVVDLEPMDVVAVAPISGPAKDAVDVTTQAVGRAFKLLLACNPAWGPGGKHTRPIVGMQSKRRFGFVYGEGGVEPFHAAIAGRSFGPVHEIKFDGFWTNNQKAGFYDELNDLLASEKEVSSEWREQLLDATGLLGHARLATTTWEAFLFAMIGVERLLRKDRKERWRENVERRILTLFSWLSPPELRRYDDGIVLLYELRNVVAHAGRVESVRHRHAALADEMLFNLLLVAYKHLDEVKSLDDLARRGALVKAQVANGERPTALPNASAMIAAFDSED